MKNKLFPILFAFPVTAGLCAATLRASILKHSPEEFSAVTSVMYGLVAVCIIATLMAVIAAFLLKGGIQFSSGIVSNLLPQSHGICAAVILIYAVLSLLPLRFEFDATKLVLALFSVYCAVALLVLGKYRLAARDETSYCIFSAVPAFWACFMIILAFRDKVSDPIISNYVFLILSYISILFFCYSLSAHVLGKKRKSFTAFSCFVGIFFILTEIFSLLFSGAFATFGVENVRELLPLVAFLVLIPSATAEILRKKD